MKSHSVQEIQEGERTDQAILHGTSNTRPCLFAYDKRKGEITSTITCLNKLHTVVEK